MPRSRQARPTVATSWTVPMTLDPWFITTVVVLALKRPISSWGSTQPWASKSTQSTSTPSCSSFQSGRRVALCSTWVVTTWSPLRIRPKIARFRASVEL